MTFFGWQLGFPDFSVDTFLKCVAQPARDGPRYSAGRLEIFQSAASANGDAKRRLELRIDVTGVIIMVIFSVVLRIVTLITTTTTTTSTTSTTTSTTSIIIIITTIITITMIITVFCNSQSLLQSSWQWWLIMPTCPRGSLHKNMHL